MITFVFLVWFVCSFFHWIPFWTLRCKQIFCSSYCFKNMRGTKWTNTQIWNFYFKSWVFFHFSKQIWTSSYGFQNKRGQRGQHQSSICMQIFPLNTFEKLLSEVFQQQMCCIMWHVSEIWEDHPPRFNGIPMWKCISDCCLMPSEPFSSLL